MKQIYFVLTRTGTILSKIIIIYTRDEFSHSSIALDQELQQMYSFGRLNPYNAFVGGFVHEYINKGTFKRFKNTKCKIFALDVEEEKYEKLKTNEAFLKIDINLFESESEITALRKYYNDIITDYNKMVKSVPSNLVALIRGYKTKAYFDGNDLEEDKDFNF